MPADQLLPLIGLIIVMIGTPGPNNLMLLTAGARFGFRRCIQHILGIMAGCQTLLLGIALGLGGLLQTYPQVALALKILCVAVLVYLAWMLVRPADESVGQPGEADITARPIGFWQAFLFQWVNPKAWMMMVTTLGTYTQPDNIVASVAVIALCFLVLGTPIISCWNLFGTWLQSWLQDTGTARCFHWAMAALLLTSLYPVLV